MAGHGAKLARKQEDAIAALLSQRNVDEAARAAGVGARTLWRWQQDPGFQAAYRKARREAFGQCIARLQQASGAAVSAVLKVMVDPSTPASTRLRAADIVLARSAQAIEIEQIEERLAKLERSARMTKKQRGVESDILAFLERLRKAGGKRPKVEPMAPALKPGSDRGLTLTRGAKDGAKADR